ncbi:DUF6928 family protein [Streptoalloteichus tenebrarius]|uniref:DUF6928 family protein n=1 Tax=Streptoalloteichus tenebrarius (strain ATCC 17920 / DSM 40477 / JCM 4838 / CBS 697.72 / NBRC 16177 / NCIMB 11028 / NRRL B-12390 / A12253. 1 / ISP 5477) TaxID=1933 RepID=UPI0035567F6D|nr:hypothetical protein GCM10020241_00660 [Streptoalloteichus tenebrarius]
MGSKAALLVLARTNPQTALGQVLVAGEAESQLLAESVRRSGSLEPFGSVTLDEAIWPEEGIVCAGWFPELDIVTSRDLAHDCPSDISEKILLSSSEDVRRGNLWGGCPVAGVVGRTASPLAYMVATRFGLG